MRIKFFLVALFLATFSAITLPSCSSDDHKGSNTIQETKTAMLAKHVWKTTEVRDNQKKKLDLGVQPAKTYAGFAYYRPDGTFRIIDFNDRPKMFGRWKLTDGETKRLLTVYNNDNTIAYARTIDFLALNNSLFTYRVVPNASQPAVYYDVDHQPVTNHPEPLTPAQILAAVDWKTVEVLDITAGIERAKKLNMNVAPAASFSGDVYYTNAHGNAYFPKNKEGKYANGSFIFTAFNNKKKVRSTGDWYVSVDGTQRTLMARNPDRSIAWERKVRIVELTTAVFTYDIQVGQQLLRVVHRPLAN
ncbi:DUF4822 domain-containing protein [Myroides sp. C15-4]|uniref:DUF4822 domain-containing protein n=1 Tax=Myroides sp. C15-4 TaxID=3400532 RepID=UPI003D2F5327